MARKGYRPGRMLILFFVGVAILYGLVAINGNWAPRLGLDLQGGTRITLVTTGDPTEESLEQAADIISQRVNGSGVTESEVTTQSGQFIVVEIPGESARELVDTVKRQAQLRFRLVACSTVNPGACGSAAPQPGTQPGLPGGQPGEQGTQQGNRQGGEQGSRGGNNRPGPAWAQDGQGESPAAEPTDGSTGGPQSPEAIPSGVQAPDAGDGGELADDPLRWMNNPDPAAVEAYRSFQCPADGSAVLVEDNPDQPIVTCDDSGIKYLLSPSAIEGTDLDDASAQFATEQAQWIVQLSFDGDGTDEFSKISNALFGTNQQFAIVLDGRVISAPTMDARILNGRAQISGDFTEESAESLATSLKYGALPVAFEDDPTAETIGPSLAGDQLSAGLWAGGFGLGLVMLYCLLYYRGLGIVVLGSLAVAATITYAMVLLLSEAAGFTLTLPGIAGLIIAVGVTADSFILFFERIRDEMREGKSMRIAVETGWRRARVTRLAANTVSLLSAAILYIFATGAVKGFGFALGLATVIDLAVLFWFTRPAVSWLGQFRFFNGGGRLSGLSPETLGMDRVPAGGKA